MTNITLKAEQCYSMEAIFELCIINLSLITHMHETVCTRPSFQRPGCKAREGQWALAIRRGLKLVLIITGSDWPRTTPQITTLTTNSTTKWDTDIAQMRKGVGDKMGVVSFLGSLRIIRHAQSPLCKHSSLVHKLLVHKVFRCIC